jgi:prophage regulatory protein
MTELVAKKQVREMITLSYAQIDRLEAANRFPKRIRVSNNRVAWIKAEVEEWITNRIAASRSTP